MIDLDELIKKKPGEHVVVLSRAHWLVFLYELIQVAILGALPVALGWLFNEVWPALLESTVARPLLILCASAYYLVVWLFFIVKFVDYYLDVYLVTNDRVVDVAQKGMFSRTVSELDLARVQDVTSDVHGVIRSIFNYGDVHIQTAGQLERFVFEDVPRPDSIRRKLLELVEEDRKRQGETKSGE